MKCHWILYARLEVPSLCHVTAHGVCLLQKCSLVAVEPNGLYHRRCLILIVEKDLHGHFEASAAVSARY
jgi:hypothetical protein